MSLFHRHHWIESERFYANPTADLKSTVTSAPVMLVQQALFGLTTILFTCECGAKRTEEILGQSVGRSAA